MEKYIVLFIYFTIFIIIGWVASKRIKSVKDYYVGGKKLGYWVVAFSSRATGESAWLLLGLTGAGAVAGVNAFWIVLGEVIGVSFAWLFMAKKFKRLTDKYNSITIPDYLVSRFQSKSNLLRKISAGILSIFIIIYVSAQIDATGSTFEAFLGWNYYAGAILGFLLVILYISIGGFLAVAWSDLVQGLMMLFGLVLLPIIGWITIAEVNLLDNLHAIDPGLVNIWGKGGLTTENVFAILGFAMIGLGFMGSPQVFVRFMSIKNEEEINKGRWVAIFYTLITDSAAVMIGITGRILFDSDMDLEGVLGTNGQNVLPVMVNELLPPVFAGIYIAIVLSAIMSTVDSLLVVASSSISLDIFKKIIRPDYPAEKLVAMSKKITVAIALLALVVSFVVANLSPDRTIFWFVIFGWSGIAAAFCPVMILSLFWKKYTEKGAITSMIVGFACVPLFKFYFPSLPEIGIYFTNMDVLFPSFVISLLSGILVSFAEMKLSKKQL